ncbi:MAG: Hsp70 family protein, partial [Pseudonocardia sp.]|nr:Hsp70 family protein [Pseudonocardia sp.]
MGIDLGTTWSAAAVCRDGEPRPEVVRLGETTASVASMVFLAQDGSMLCGEAAHRRAVTDSRLVVREFKRRIGDDTPLVVDGNTVAAETVAARFVAWILAVVGDREGGPAERVTLTHPAEWGSHKRDALDAALAVHGVTGVAFLSEPEAAAIGYASEGRVGSAVAVYDLGGGTFDAAVVRRVDGGGFEILGRPVGIEHLGGVDFDEAVFDHVRDAVGEAWLTLDPFDPDVQTAVAGLRRECTAAKEALSADTEVMVPVMLPGHHSQVRLGRAEFEERIRPAIVETVEALRRAIASAGSPDLDAVLMVGGSSRIPLVAQLVSAELGRPIAVDVDPKSVIATGAAVSARGPLAVAPGVAVSDVSPPCPPMDHDPVVEEVAEPAPARPRPVRVLTLAAAVAAVATIGLGAATIATGVDPAGGGGFSGPLSGIGGFVSSAGAAEPAPGIDPWTGDARTDTTEAGPQRPALLAAAARPADRTTPTGAAGASPAAGPVPV